MIEFLLCSLVTILPDYLFRRYVQGKRFGHEITFFSVWYVLRWGISACVILTLLLITMIFYFHPATTNVVKIYRTVTILPEEPGRVNEVMVRNFQDVSEGDVLFTMDDSRQRAAVVTARTALAEVQAGMALAEAELATAQFQVENNEASLELAEVELARVQTLIDRGSAAVNQQDLDQRRARVGSLGAAVKASEAQVVKAEENLNTLLPAQMEASKAALAQAEVELDKTIIRAGVDGQITQFALQKGDIVNPLLRPAGILIPKDGHWNDAIQAGFNQISAQVVKPGVITELACVTLPLTVFPMVITDVQNVIAAGQLRPTDQLVEIETRGYPGTLTVRMEPLYKNDPKIDRILPGTKCIANAYTNNHERIASGEVTGLRATALHAVDATGLVHALILRIQTLLLPIQTLVLSGH